MSYYIDTANTDMKKFAFEQTKGIDLPYWKDLQSVDEIEIKHISGAMTNVIYKVVVVGKPCQPLLLRIYGNCTDIFMNRELEIHYFKILSDNNFGVSLVKIFPGGRLEVWREGYDPLTAPQMRSEKYSKEIAQTMAVMHNIRLESYGTEEFHAHFTDWCNKVKEICKKDEFKQVNFDLLQEEINSMFEMLDKEDYETVMGHFDLQHGNILLNEEDKMIFVDFEYTGRIPVAADMANHFCEWMTDYNLPDSHILRLEWHPNEEQQRLFVRTYLQARFNREPSEEEVEKLRIQAIKHELFSNMHWLLWGLLQYQVSDIDWDYWEYFKNRWGHYVRVKKMFGGDALPVFVQE